MSNTLMIFVTHFFYGLNFKKSKKNYIVHQFHGITPQNTSTKSKKLWFEPLQLWLSTHVLHFFKNMLNTSMIFVTHFFYSLNVKESKNNYTMHQFHGIAPQKRSTKSKKILFEPLQLCLSSHVLQFFQIMSNTLMIFMTHFFYGLNVKESKKKLYRAPVPWNNTSKYKYMGKITIQIDNTLHYELSISCQFCRWDI